MATLKLNQSFITGLEHLAHLPEEAFQDFVSALSEMPKEIDQRTIFNVSAISLTGMPEDDLDRLKEVAFALHLLRTEPNVPPDAEQVIDDIVASFIKQQKPDSPKRVEGKTVLVLRNRLTTILQVESLSLIAKANDILHAHHRVLGDVRILSDMRPIYSRDVTGAPDAAVIVHTLQIDFEQDGVRKQFFVALDSKDIGKLLEQLERAKNKTESLQAALTAAGITHLKVI